MSFSIRQKKINDFAGTRQYIKGGGTRVSGRACGTNCYLASQVMVYEVFRHSFWSHGTEVFRSPVAWYHGILVKVAVTSDFRYRDLVVASARMCETYEYSNTAL